MKPKPKPKTLWLMRGVSFTDDYFLSATQRSAMVFIKGEAVKLLGFPRLRPGQEVMIRLVRGQWRKAK